MNRTSLMAALGAVVLLAGCSSTSGTATPNTSAASSSSAAVSAPAAASSAPSSAAGTGSSEAPSSNSASTDSAGAGSSSSGSSSSDSSSSESSSSARTTTTIGDNNSSLDAPSAAWFSAFCGGFGPVVDMAKTVGTSIAGQASNPAKAQSALVLFYSKIGQAFTDTSATLRTLPPPTFAGGPEFAIKVVTALAKAGPVFTDQAAKLQAVDVTKDPTAFATALSGLSTNMTTALAPLQDLGSLKLTPQTQKAFEALPACAKLKATTG